MVSRRAVLILLLGALRKKLEAKRICDMHSKSKRIHPIGLIALVFFAIMIIACGGGGGGGTNASGSSNGGNGSTSGAVAAAATVSGTLDFSYGVTTQALAAGGTEQTVVLSTPGGNLTLSECIVTRDISAGQSVMVLRRGSRLLNAQWGDNVSASISGISVSIGNNGVLERDVLLQTGGFSVGLPAYRYPSGINFSNGIVLRPSSLLVSPARMTYSMLVEVPSGIGSRSTTLTINKGGNFSGTSAVLFDGPVIQTSGMSNFNSSQSTETSSISTISTRSTSVFDFTNASIDIQVSQPL